MKNRKKFYVNSLLFASAAVLLVLSASSDLRRALFNKAAFGYGAESNAIIISGNYSPYAPRVSAVNVPVSLSFNQSGTVSRTFDQLNSAYLRVSEGTVDEPVTFSVSRHTDGAYIIGAKDSRGDDVVFNQPVEVTIVMPFPENLMDYNMYVLSPETRKWTRVSGVDFYSYASEISFEIEAPGVYRLMSASLVNALNAADFREGMLLRGSNRRIYAITNGRKYHIRSLQELRNNYRGLPISNVIDEILDLY